MNIYTCTHTHLRIHKYTHIHTYIHRYIYTQTYAYMHIHKYTRTHKHIVITTNIETHIYIYTYVTLFIICFEILHTQISHHAATCQFSPNKCKIIGFHKTRNTRARSPRKNPIKNSIKVEYN